MTWSTTSPLEKKQTGIGVREYTHTRPWMGVNSMEKYPLRFREKSVQSVLQRGQNKFVQLSFEAGEGLTKHRAPLGLTVIVLTGKIRFTVGEQTEVVDSSEMLALEPGIEHELKAIEKSTVLLVLTPDGEPTASPSSNTDSNKNSSNRSGKNLDYVNAYMQPELIEQITPELQPLVRDHIELCKVLKATENSPDTSMIQTALEKIKLELDHHFTAEEKVVFPRMAIHVGGMDIGPVARLLEEHREIRRLHGEAEELLSAAKSTGDAHAKSLLTNKMDDLSRTLLNHLGKEDSHLFPMTSRLLTTEEKTAIARELGEYLLPVS